MVKILFFTSKKLNYSRPILMGNYLNCENKSLIKNFIKKGEGPIFNIHILMM
jgi:hypothetical protein